jgi:hypothetical protein
MTGGLCFILTPRMRREPDLDLVLTSRATQGMGGLVLQVLDNPIGAF